MKKIVSLIIAAAMFLSIVNVSASAKEYDTVAFIGGSITEQNTWVGSGKDPMRENEEYEGLAQYFGREYNAQYVINAGVSGTGSALAAYRLNDQVLKYNPNLVFIEFAVNDSTRTDGEKMREVEALIRLIREHDANTEIALLFTAARNERVDSQMQQKLADHYGLKFVDLYDALLTTFTYGKTTHQSLDTDGDGKLSEAEVVDWYTTGPHVNDAGGHRYADYIKTKIEANDSILGYKPKNVESLSGYNMSNPQFISAAASSNDICHGDWKQKVITTNSFYNVGNTPDKSELTKASKGAACLTGTVNVNAMKSSNIGDALIFDFEGSSVGLVYYLHSAGALVTYNIDNGLRTGLIDTYLENTDYQRNADFYISDLPAGNHTITFEIVDRSTFAGMDYAGKNANEFALAYLLSDSGSTYVDKETTDSTKVFELGKDNVGNFINTVDNTTVAINGSGEITSKDFLTLNGLKTGLHFDGNEYMSIEIPEIENADGQTFFVWAKPDKLSNNSLYLNSFLSYSDVTGAHSPAVDLYFENGTDYYAAGIFTGYKDSNYSQFVGNNNGSKLSWMAKEPDFRCYAVTRKWDGQTNKWMYKTYISWPRSKYISEDVNLSLANETEGFRGDESNMELYIGGGAQGNYIGTLGGVSVYNRALSSKEISEKILSQRSNYIEVLDTDNNFAVTGIKPSNTYSIPSGNTTFDITFNKSINDGSLSGIKLFKINDDSSAENVDAEVYSDASNSKIVHLKAVLEDNAKYRLSVDGTVLSISGLNAAAYSVEYKTLNAGLVFSMQANDDGTIINSENKDSQITVVGTPSVKTNYISDLSKFNTVKFDGSSYIDAAVPELRNLSDVTYEIWVKPDENDNTATESNPWGIWGLSDKVNPHGVSSIAQNWFYYPDNNYYFTSIYPGMSNDYSNNMYFNYHATINQIMTPATEKIGWTHYVITRSVSDRHTVTHGNDIAECGTYNYTGSVNGWKYNDMTRSFSDQVIANEENFDLLIGANTENAGGLTRFFKGEIGEINVYNRILSEEEILNAYNRSKDKYNDVIELADTLELDETIPADGAKLSISAKNIVLKFNNFVDKTTLGAIKLTDSDGNEVSGYTVELDDNTRSSSKTVKINLSQTLVPFSKYKVIINDGLKSINNKTASPIEKVFTTGNNGEVFKLLINDDGTISNSENSSTVVQKFGNPAVKSMINNSNAVTKSLYFDGSAYFDVNCDEVRNLTEATYVIWVKPDENDNTATESNPWGIWGLSDKANQYGVSAISQNWFYYPDNNYYYTDFYPGMSNDYSNNKYYNYHSHFNQIMNPATEKPDWTQYVITRSVSDKSTQIRNNNTTDIGTYNYTVSVNGIKYDSLSKSFSDQVIVNEENFDLFIGANIENAGALTRFFKGQIGDITVYDRILTDDEISSNYSSTKSNFVGATELSDSIELISTTPGSLDDDNSNEMLSTQGSIELTFNNFVDSSTIGAISFTTENGGRIPGGYKAYVNEDDMRKVTVKFGLLKEGEIYKLNIRDTLKSVNGYSTKATQRAFAVVTETPGYSVLLLNQNGEELTNVSESTSIIAQIDIGLYNEIIESYVPIMAVYKDNKLVSSAMGKINKKSDGSTAATVSISNIDSTDGINNVRVFLWDKHMSPVIECVKRGNMSNGNIAYLEYSVSDMLNPATMTANNFFAAKDGSEDTEKVENVIYIPALKTAGISVNKNVMNDYNQIKANDIFDIDGNAIDLSFNF